MLRYLSEQGISPGDRVRVTERQPFGGPLLVSLSGEREQAIGGQLARAMRVVLDGQGAEAESGRSRSASGRGAPAGGQALV
jgi:Fe2+ transport system protein FeoA